MKKTSISVVQYAPLFSNIDANSRKILSYSRSINSNIVIFPELSLSGYNFDNIDDLEKSSNTIDCAFFDTLSEVATNQDKIICLGFAEKANTEFYNSSILLLPNGERHVYRKTHLFFREKYFFQPGDTGFNVFYYEPWDINIGMMICYDWRFPEAARSLALKGADIILCPSNLVTDVWHISMPSRALENHVYLATANRIGTEVGENCSLVFTGKSAIYDCNGAVMALASLASEEVISTSINHTDARVKSFNSINSIFDDRRPEMYA